MAGEVFHRFTSLAPELQILIWKEALREEVKTRRVMVDPTCLRVLPRRGLVSPLLSVNRVGHWCAKAFYDAKVDVYRLPPPWELEDAFGDETSFKMEEWAEELGQLEGCIHVSTRFDMFVIDIVGEFWQIHIDLRWMPYFASSVLTRPTCRLVENVAKVTLYDHYRLERKEEVVAQHWMTGFFSGICHYFHTQNIWNVAYNREEDHYEEDIPLTFRECMWAIHHDGSKKLVDKEIYTKEQQLERQLLENAQVDP